MNKPGFGLSFWSLYTLGFTVVLPTVLYYTSDDMHDPPQKSAVAAFAYLATGIVLWLTVIFLYGRFYFSLVFSGKRRLEATARNGVTIVARITGKKQTGTLRDMAVLDLKLAFKNLAGTEVEIPYQVNDGKPAENRFEVGNTFEMRASLDEKHAVLVPRSMEVVRNKGVVATWTVVFFLLLAATIVYPVFSYRLESQGYGWRFLQFTHPWILVPFCNLCVVALMWFIVRLIGMATGDTSQPLRMILHGIRTTGTIVSYELTGTYINEQPQVRFEVEFPDQHGGTRTVQCKKIVSLLEMHKISTGPREIMYLPGQPENIIFYEDLSL